MTNQQVSIVTAAKIERDPAFVSFYINAAHVAMSFADVRIYLCETMPKRADIMTVGSPPEITAETWLERTGLIITPEYLKIFSQALSEAVKTYEERFGTIRNKPSESSGTTASVAPTA